MKALDMHVDICTLLPDSDFPKSGMVLQRKLTYGPRLSCSEHLLKSIHLNNFEMKAKMFFARTLPWNCSTFLAGNEN